MAAFVTMTMTVTHSDKVSTGCQPCPTDANGEVVTSEKKSVETDEVLRDAQVARSIPVRRQVVTRNF